VLAFQQLFSFRLKSIFVPKNVGNSEYLSHLSGDENLLTGTLKNLKILELKVTGFCSKTIFVNFDLRLTQINAENKFSWNVVKKSHD
jgi:hypothetical protein